MVGLRPHYVVLRYATLQTSVTVSVYHRMCIFRIDFVLKRSTAEFKNSFNAITKFFSLQFFVRTIHSHKTYDAIQTNVLYSNISGRTLFLLPVFRLCALLCSLRSCCVRDGTKRERERRKKSYKYKIMKNYTKLFACFMIHISLLFLPFVRTLHHARYSFVPSLPLRQGSSVGCGNVEVKR